MKSNVITVPISLLDFNRAAVSPGKEMFSSFSKSMLPLEIRNPQFAPFPYVQLSVDLAGFDATMMKNY